MKDPSVKSYPELVDTEEGGRSTLAKVMTKEQRRAIVAERVMNGEGYLAIAESLGVHRNTIMRDVIRLRTEWQERAQIDVAWHFGESLARYEHYEKLALQTGNIPSAITARNGIVKLLGLARPEQFDIAHGGAVTLQVEYVLPATAVHQLETA